IGTDVTGTAALPNTGSGIVVIGSDNTIGDTACGARNIISANRFDGVYLAGSGSSGNLVQGNYIGTDITGTAALGNGVDGVRIFDGTSNPIGGTTAAARNIISGNGGAGVGIASFNGYYSGGVTLPGGGSDMLNVVEGNYIGTDVSGTAAL